MLKKLLKLGNKFKVIIKFLISGCTATAVDLGFLYFFTDIMKIYYLVSAVIAFILAFFVSFGMQKFWTFRDNSRDKINRQLSQYLTVTLFNLLLNMFGLYIMVEKFNIMYLVAQFFMGGFIAIISFITYRFVIFTTKNEPNFDRSQKID